MENIMIALNLKLFNMKHSERGYLAPLTVGSNCRRKFLTSFGMTVLRDKRRRDEGVSKEHR